MLKEMLQSFLPQKESLPRLSLNEHGDSEQSGVKVGQYYKRSGSCHTCGKCCKDIFLIHEERTIETLQEFESLKDENPEYTHFIPVRETVDGLQFQCKHLSAENRCLIYLNRPDFCRKYPSEKTILLGGKLAEGCGYQFELLKSFGHILEEVAEKPSPKPFKLDRSVPSLVNQPTHQPESEAG
jgi:Fe-S-cluster containining protein